MRKIWGWLFAVCFICVPFSRGYAADWSLDTVVLREDTTVESSVVISGEKTLDLNGYELRFTGSGSLFSVGSGANLTIQDSASDTAEEKALLIRESAVSAASGAQPASYEKNSAGKTVLTWYETRSTITNDGYHTTEALYKCTASGLGCIIDAQADESSSPLISVSGGGNLVIEGGAIFGAKNHAISLEDNNTVMTITGGYLLGNEADKGGAVIMRDASLNMEGGVMSGNTATGANSGEGGEHYGGGAVCLEGGAEFQMTGGMLTNNKATSASYFDGGGAVLVNGNSTFQMGSSQMGNSQPGQMVQITGNEAASGGGVRTGWKQSATFKMNDGIIAGNVARTAEGGGVSVNMNGIGYVVRGYVTNNKTNTTQHWGGGGLFCSDGSSLIMNGTLITENAAGGFGGGIGGCSTGRIDIVSMDIAEYGAAIFANTAAGKNTSGDESVKSADHLYAKDSPVFMANGYQDFFCALSSHIADKMLGGGSAGWKGSIDGRPAVIPKDGNALATYIAGLTAYPTQTDRQAAVNKARSIASAVYISGNYSYTHGGGILCNGYLLFGPEDNREILIGDQMVIDGSKLLLDGLTLDPLEIQENDYHFTVKDANGNAVSNGRNLASGEIVFDRMIPFTQPGTFVYTVQEETAGRADGIAGDGSVYRLTVDVAQADSSYGNVFTVRFFRISRVKVERIQGETVAVVSDALVSSYDSNAYHVNLFFNNYKTYVGDLTVKKVWEGNANHPESIVVRLKRGGNVIDEQKLSAANGWTYTWEKLDVENNAYTVEEDMPQGYTLTRIVQVSPVFGKNSYWVPAEELKQGRQYLVVSPDGRQALKIPLGKEDAPLTVDSKQAVTPGSGSCKVGNTTYEDWYAAEQMDGNSIFSPKKYGDEGMKFQNVGTSAYLLAQQTDGNYLKTAGTGPTYGSFFSYEDGKLLATHEWKAANEKRPVVYQDDKFTTVGSAENADQKVKLYMLISDPISSQMLVTLTNTFDPTKVIGNLPQTGDHSNMVMWATALVGALAVMGYVNRKNRLN